MFNLVSLVAAAALVSFQCRFEAYAQLDGKNDLDNHLQRNVIASPKRHTLRPFVNISTPPPATARLEPGTRLELACEILGHPSPTAQWLKNGEPMAAYDDDNNILPIHPSSLTRLTSKLVISAASDGDVFTCVATSGLKQHMASTTVYTTEDEENLFTIEALFRKPSKPVITEAYNDVFQDQGTSIVLPCRYYSSAQAQVYWTDSEGKPIFSDAKMRILPSGGLLITDLTWDDVGNYTCTVKNMYGKDSMDTFLYPAKKQ